MSNHATFARTIPTRILVSRGAATLALAAAGIVLAYAPVDWLVTTWMDPAYDSYGLVVSALVAALFCWSWSSPLRRAPASGAQRHLPWALLAASAISRLAGQVLAINTLGALMLVLDVYALALLARLGERTRAVSPAWLAVAFLFSLPLERIIQRSIGHILQLASAEGACAVLGAMFASVECSGVRIALDGKDVLVDLPCSGARTLALSLMAFAIAAAIARAGTRSAVVGFLIALTAAFAANVLRITVLAVGIAHPDMLGGIDVMAAPWHDGIGALALAAALVPIVAWMRRNANANAGGRRRRPADQADAVPHSIRTDGWWLAQTAPPRPTTMQPGLPVALMALAAAMAIAAAPRKAIDVARPDNTLALPGWISGLEGMPVALTAREAAYFTAYGGAAAKMSYGPHAVMAIRTTSPLRHLHAPDECLRGLGFQVRYAGLQFEPAPTAVYLATSPAGDAYRIDVTYVSDTGSTTSNVAAAVWRWLNGQDRSWTAIQRISPITIEAGRHQQFSEAALASLVAQTPAARPQRAMSSNQTKE